jgi:Icc-related predicted phosphoesterase
VIACHYPVAVPDGVTEKRGHGLRGVAHLRKFLGDNAPNLYCHGHIHTTWSFAPAVLPRTLCLNPGAALKRSGTGAVARMLEILLDGEGVRVLQHQLRYKQWEQRILADIPGFFCS